MRDRLQLSENWEYCIVVVWDAAAVSASQPTTIQYSQFPDNNLSALLLLLFVKLLTLVVLLRDIVYLK